MAAADRLGDSPRPRRALRLALAGGGTGGHVLPGRHLLAHVAGRGELADVLWLGTGRRAEERSLEGLEGALAPVPLEIVRLPLERAGGGAPSRAGLVLRTPAAWLRARRALRAHGSDVLLGLGGFGCLPGVLAARSLGTPIALLEVNATAGAATRRLGRCADLVAHAWRASLPPRTATGAGSSRHVHLGPPLPPGLAAPSDAEREAARRALGFALDRPLLLVLGGSQGASALNAFVRASAPELARARVQVLHQVGPGKANEAALPFDGYRASEYVDDVRPALRAATLVLTRGGASTLAEVAAARTPALVVPYPHHADRHQERNARELGEGVVLARESELGPAASARLIELLAPESAGSRAACSAALARAWPRAPRADASAPRQRLGQRLELASKRARAGLGGDRGAESLRDRCRQMLERVAPDD